MWMNEFDVQQARRQFADHAVMAEPTAVLERFMNWVNENSDGWPYWKAASAASRKLQALIVEAQRDYRAGNEPWASHTQLLAAYKPIKALLTKHGAGWAEVLFRA